MMTKPTYYPEWASSDTTLPVAGTSNKQRPKDSLRTIGFDKSQIPTAQEFNWQLDNVYDWVVYLDTNNTTSKTFTLTGDVTGSASYTNEAGFSVATTVTDNSHNHISANITDATENDTANTIVKRNSSGDAAFHMVYSDVTGNLSGNSATASKWQTARTLYLTGDVTGNASIDGSGNVNLSTTVVATSVTTSIYTGSTSTASVILSSYDNRELIVCLVDGDNVCFGNIPIAFIKNIKTSGYIYLDYGDSGDFILTYSYTAGTLSLSSARGNIVEIYLR